MPKKNRKRKVPVTQIATKTTNNNNNKKSKSDIKENVSNTNNNNNTNNTNENGNVIKEINWTHDPLEVFKWLIHPITPQKFFDEYWEKKPLVIKRNNKEYYNNIFSKKELDTILNNRDIFLRRNLNICRCVDGKKVLYQPEINDDTIVDVNEKGEEFVKLEAKEVWDLYNKKGNTIQFYQPQQYSEHLSMIMSKLESFFGCLVGSNSYFTPIGTQGLAPHYDDVEVFVLQLEGSKNWNLYKVFKDLPSVYSPDFEKEKLGKPSQTVNLQQGDFLYFPRGTIHEAMSPKNVESHHLTMSTYQNNNFKEFLTGTIQNALNDAFDEDKEFREGMPLNYFSVLGNINKSEKTGKPVDNKEILPPFFSSTISNKDKQKFRSLFQNKLLSLYRKLEKYLDIDKIADETSLDFVVNRLPPLSPQSIPPHPPLQRGMMDNEDEEESSDEEGDEAPQLIKENGSKKKPVNDKDDKEDDDEDDDDDDDENLEAIWSTAPNSDKQSVRLVNPDLLRILRNTTNPTHSFNNEPKDEVIEVFTSVLNQNDQHMSGHEKIPVSVPFTITFEESLKFLVSSYPKFVKIKSLPLKDSEERLALSVGLWNIGALEIQN